MKGSTSTEKLPSIDPEEDVVQPVKSIFPQHFFTVQINLWY